VRPLAAVPAYDVRPVEVRVVPSDCHISYGAVPYSVDPVAAHRSVKVRAEGEAVGDRFDVYLGEQLVARHWRRPKGSPRVTLPEHAAAIRELTRGAGQAAGRRRSRQPKYEQVPEKAALDLLAAIQQRAPQVEVRTLGAYERLAGGVR